VSRLDRYGELEQDEVDEVSPVHHCHGGWIDRDATPARPCLSCKPHLALAIRRAALNVDCPK